MKNEEMIKNQKEIIEELNKTIDNQQQQILDLQVKLENSTNGSGRKSQVLELLRKFKTISILDISNELSISTKNVSSQLTYLRSDGYQIYTDPNGRKMLVEEKQTSNGNEYDEGDSINKDLKE